MSSAPRTAARRELVLAVAGCAIAGAVVLFAAGRRWVHYVVGGGGQASGGPTGHDVAAGGSALGLVMLAAVVALPATRGWLRRVVALVVVAAGAGTIALAGYVLADPAAAAGGSGYVGFFSLSPDPTVRLRATGWPWVDVVAGAVALAAGGFALLRSGSWLTMGRRYESGRPSAKPSSGSSDGSSSDALSMWDRLDEGDDPTL
jgi:uncharacterized membrane protein (TIGR02234 family)